MTRRAIPAAVMAVVAEISSSRESHASLDNLYTYAGASGDPPPGSKPVKALAWLRETNKDASIAQPLDVVGRVIEVYMDTPWYVAQPFADDLNLDLPDEEIYRITQERLKAIEGSSSASAWSERMTSRLQQEPYSR